MDDEYNLILSLVQGFKRSRRQINRVYESDAELLQVSLGTKDILALTTDTLVEEIASGLYADLGLIGWMAVMTNASDLAAVGAQPLGILMSQTLPPLSTPELAQLQAGVGAACDVCSLPLLGGDINFADSLQLTGTAVGVVEEGKAMTRKGCSPGDLLCVTGPLGCGNLFAFYTLLKGEKGASYKPIARLMEGQILRNFATSCIDTSDGFFSSLEDLGRVNQVGFYITDPYTDLLCEGSSEFPLPPWMLLAGHHGEYELAFTIPKEKWQTFLSIARQKGMVPLQVGYVTQELGIHSRCFCFGPGRVRALWSEAGGDLQHYIHHLIEEGSS